MKLSKLIIITISIFLFSCEFDEDKDCLANTLDTHSLEEIYNCADTRHNTQIDLSDNYIIIRSQSQFNNLVTGDCLPQINFSTYDLVIGKKGLTSGNETINYNYYYDCSLGNLVLEVEFIQNIASVAPNLTYHALIPKLGDEETVAVEISVI